LLTPGGVLPKRDAHSTSSRFIHSADLGCQPFDVHIRQLRVLVGSGPGHDRNVWVVFESCLESWRSVNRACGVSCAVSLPCAPRVPETPPRPTRLVTGPRLTHRRHSRGGSKDSACGPGPGSFQPPTRLRPSRSASRSIHCISLRADVFAAHLRLNERVFRFAVLSSLDVLTRRGCGHLKTNVACSKSGCEPSM